jgi:hypothetical protein
MDEVKLRSINGGEFLEHLSVYQLYVLVTNRLKHCFESWAFTRELNTRFRVMPTVRMLGAFPLLLHTSSLYDAVYRRNK